MVGRKRCTQGCHGIAEARLVQGDNIHIALAENQLPVVGRFCKIQGEQVVGLLKDQGVGRIEIFRFGIVQNPAAECDDIAPNIDNGNHDAVSKYIVQTARTRRTGAAFRQKSGNQLFVVEALLTQSVPKRLIAIRRKTQAKTANRMIRVAAAVVIVQADFPFRPIEPGVKQPRGLSIRLQDTGTQTGGGVVYIVFRHFHSGPIR